MTRWRSTLALVLVPAALSLAVRAFAAPERRPVPEVVGLAERDAYALLSSAGFGFEAEDVAGEPAGTVASQTPGGFAWADAKATITLSVKRGAGWKPGSSSANPNGTGPSRTGPDRAPPPSSTATPRVPNVLGKTEAEALDLLRPWKVQLATIAGSSANDGRVVDQDPAAGTALAEGDTVSVTVARTDAGSSTTSTVPSVVGLDEETASRRLSDAGLVPLVDMVRSDPANAGKVVGQDPAAGTVVSKNSNVAVMVGRRMPSVLLEVEVPDCRRLAEPEARKRAEKAGFVVLVKDRLAPPETAGTVLEQDPAAGTRLSTGRTVTLTVGRLLLLPLAVPDVAGLDAATAEKALRDAGFDVERTLSLSLPGSTGKVILQEPAGGATANRGATVKITIGRLESAVAQTVVVPALVGRSEAQARTDLAAAGLSARSTAVAIAPGEPAGSVRGQSPAAGTSVARGSEVVIEVASAVLPGAGVVLPSYVGQDAASAQTDLAARGLRVGLVYLTATPEGRVLTQSPPAGSSLPGGALVTLTISRAPTLGAVGLVDPPQGKSVPKNFGVTFQWNAVQDAEEYEFESMVDKDGAWVVNAHNRMRSTSMRPGNVKKGTYQWHVRATKAGGTIVGPWSEWRRLTIY